MMRWVVGVCAVLIVAGCKSDPTPKAISHVSEGGIPFTLLNMPGVKDVALHAAWPTDWAFRADVNPVTPYVGANLLLAGGAVNWPSGAAVEKFEDIKAEAQLSVTPDYILGYLVAPRENIQEAIEITNTHLTKPAFDRDWLDRFSDQLFGTIAQARSQPRTAAIDALRIAILGDTPINASLALSNSNAFERLSEADIRAWHSEVFVTAGMRIVIAGDLDQIAAGKMIDALLADIPVGRERPAARVTPDFSPRKIVVDRQDAESASILIVVPLPPTRAGGELDDYMIINRFGQGDQSVLFDVVRTKLRASYSIIAAADAYTRDTRIFVITGEVEPDQVASVLSEVKKAYEGFRIEGTIHDFETVKKLFSDGAKESATRPGAAGFPALMGLLDDHDPAVTLDMSPLLDALTRDSVATRLRDVYVGAEDMVVVVATPKPSLVEGACVISAPEQAVDC